MPKIKKQELVEIENSNNDIAIQAENQWIVSQADVDKANIILRNITKQMKAIEKKRKSFTQPLNQSLGEINSTFKELVKPLEIAKDILTQKVMDWRDTEKQKIQAEQERIRKEEERRRKIQEAHKEKGHEVSEPIVMAKPKPLKETDTTHIRKVWEFEIIEMAKIPHEYLMVNKSFIREAIRDGVRIIPGIRIYQEERMVIK